jgi:hypothetical protein
LAIDYLVEELENAKRRALEFWARHGRKIRQRTAITGRARELE